MENQTPSSPENNKVFFRPLTEGLGFHPFSDGLPYAPVAKAPLPKVIKPGATKASSPMGVGAESAGPPRFASSPKSVEIQKQVFPQVTKMSAQESKNLKTEDKKGVGYLVRRSIAYLIDLSVNTAIFGILLNIWLFMQPDTSPDIFLNFKVLLKGMVLLSLFNWVLLAFQEVLFGSSFGKRVFHFKLGGSKAARLFRSFTFLPSSLFFGLGLTYGLFNSKKQCLHDALFGIQPIETF